MASEAFLDPSYLMALRCMASAHVTGDLMQPSIHSGNLLQKEASSTTSDSSIVQQESQVSQIRAQGSKRKKQQGTQQPKLLKKKKSTIDPSKKELSNSSQTRKRNKLENKEDAALQRQAMQQLLQNPASLRSQGRTSLLEALTPQHGFPNVKQRGTFQTVPGLPEIDLKQQHQQQKQVEEYLQQLALRRVNPPPQLFNGNVCYRRLMQYMYHLQHRPPSNDLSYWRKFVSEYFAPGAKKRWCLSTCDSVGHHAVGVFPQAAMAAWHCELCGSTSGKGFEATSEVLPRLNKIQFETGVTDELLFLDLPQECRLPCGSMALEYGKAVHETVYNQFHVVREGKLRVTFTRDLKISCWEFCSREHEELLPRSLVMSQVNDFIHTAQQCQTAIEGGKPGRTPADLRENCNALLSAGCSLERNLDLQLAGDIGFPKRYIRCLQIAEIVNSMKDLMTFSFQNRVGAIESLKSCAKMFPSLNTPAPTQESDSLSKEIELHGGSGQPLSDSHCQGSMNECMTKDKDGVFNTIEEAALADYGSYVKLLSQTPNQMVARLGEPSYLYKQFTQGAPTSFTSDSSIIQEHIRKLLQGTSSKNQTAGWTEREVVNNAIDDMLAGFPTTTSRNSDAYYNSRNRLPSDHSSSAATSAGSILADFLSKTQSSTAASSWESSSACVDRIIRKGRNQQERLGQSEEYEAFRKLFDNGMSDGSIGDSTSFGWKG